ncbi:hypothetical protein PAMA_015000 [Pampus argenteus]
MTQCKENFFNDGSNAYCQPCTSCPAGLRVVSKCNSITDTQCQDPSTGSQTTTFPDRHVSAFFSKTSMAKQESNLGPHATTTSHHVLWAVPFVIIISMVLVLSACIYIKRKRRMHIESQSLTRRSSCMNAGFSSFSASPENNLEDILSPEIVSAPLQTVLDNLDVLEELVILLDPESHCVKYTKHLATKCSFPSTWITYTYSMRDSKSPLKAVLEALTSRYPDWTVGHLAKMLRQMDRNDAVFALSKLKFNQMDCLDHSCKI